MLRNRILILYQRWLHVLCLRSSSLYLLLVAIWLVLNTYLSILVEHLPLNIIDHLWLLPAPNLILVLSLLLNLNILSLRKRYNYWWRAALLVPSIFIIEVIVNLYITRLRTLRVNNICLIDPNIIIWNLLNNLFFNNILFIDCIIIIRVIKWGRRAATTTIVFSVIRDLVPGVSHLEILNLIHYAGRILLDSNLVKHSVLNNLVLAAMRHLWIYIYSPYILLV